MPMYKHAKHLVIDAGTVPRIGLCNYFHLYFPPDGFWRSTQAVKQCSADGLRCWLLWKLNVFAAGRWTAAAAAHWWIAPLWTPFRLTCLWITFSTYNTVLQAGPLRRNTCNRTFLHWSESLCRCVLNWAVTQRESTTEAFDKTWKLSFKSFFCLFWWEIMSEYRDNRPFVPLSHLLSQPGWSRLTWRSGVSAWINHSYWYPCWLSPSESWPAEMDLQVLVWLFYCFLLPTALLTGN